MDPASGLRRAQCWFWTLTVVAVALVGALSKELTARPGPAIGAAVAGTGLVLALVAAQVVRVMASIDRATRSGSIRSAGSGSASPRA